VDDRMTRSNAPIEKGRLANVGPTDYRNYLSAHLPFILRLRARS